MSRYPGNRISSGTFHIIGDNLHRPQPPIKVADPNLVNPRNAACLLDGEFVKTVVGKDSSPTPATLVGSRRVKKLLAADCITLSGTGSSQTIAAYVDSEDSSRPLAFGREIAMVHGRPGRGDLQAGGVVTILQPPGRMEFMTRLIDDDATIEAGTRLFVDIIANASLVSYLTGTLGVTRDVAGLTTEARAIGGDAAGDAGLNGKAIWALGYAMGGKDAGGWVHVVYDPHPHVLSGYTN